MENYEQIATIMKALADPKRLKIFDLLSTADSLCACEVLEHDFTQPTLSHHMKLLEKAGIVKVTKKSQWHHYALQEDFVEDFLVILKELLIKEKSISW